MYLPNDENAYDEDDDNDDDDEEKEDDDNDDDDEANGEGLAGSQSCRQAVCSQIQLQRSAVCIMYNILYLRMYATHIVVCSVVVIVCNMSYVM